MNDVLMLLYAIAINWKRPRFLEGSTIIQTVLHIVLLILLVLCVFGRRWIPGVFYPKKNEGSEDVYDKFSYSTWLVPGYGMAKKLLYIALLALLAFCVCGRSWIPGIYYPKKTFVYDIVDDEYPMKIFFTSCDGINSFKDQLRVTTLTNKRYDILRIKKASYEWERNTGEFLKDDKDVKFRLNMSKSYFKDGWYEDRIFMEFGQFNPEKLFKGKKIGNKFKLYLKVVYSFDDEPEETITFQYDVKVVKGEY